MGDGIGDVLDGVRSVFRLNMKQLVAQKLLHSVQSQTSDRTGDYFRSDDVQKRGQEKRWVELVKGPVKKSVFYHSKGKYCDNDTLSQAPMNA